MKILYIYTGGTFGKHADYFDNFNCKKLAICKDIIEYTPIDSSLMNSKDWVNIATDIYNNYEYDGFIVIMGTDTMAYCASAIAFMFENMSKPIIFTGAMIPLILKNTDAVHNLQNSIHYMKYAVRKKMHQVFICFDKLYQAVRCTKTTMPTSPFAAKSFNKTRKSYNRKVTLQLNMDTPILVVKITPNNDYTIPINTKAIIFELWFGKCSYK